MAIYSDYLNDYSDLKDSYNNWLNNQNNIHWSDYVNASPDLLSAWSAENVKTGVDKWSWGYQHYQNSGKNEGRPTPKIISTNGLPDIPGERGRGGYTRITVYQDSSGKPQSTSEAEEFFGYNHWTTAGSSEDRTLKGPKFIQDDAGNLVVNKDIVGSGAQQRYQEIAKRFNDAPPGSYPQLLRETYDSLPDNEKIDFNSSTINVINQFQKTKGFSEYTPGGEKKLGTYKETLRAPTDLEKSILREVLLTAPKDGLSWTQKAADEYVNKKGEDIFKNLSVDVLKQTTNAYKDALQKEQVSSMLGGMGLSGVTDMKENIKNSIIGDLNFGGFIGTNQKEALSDRLDKALGIGSSVQYNWQKWFDDTITKRYQDLDTLKKLQGSELSTEDQKELDELQKLGQAFVQDYLKPRFDTSKSISEFISYMDVTEKEQNVLQTQLASSALKDYAQRQAENFINTLGETAVTKEFDPKFYRNPELLTGTDKKEKEGLYTRQKEELASLNPDAIVENVGKTWKELAYEYGLDIVNNPDDFARLHYEIIGRNKGYDPVADSYTTADLYNYVKTDLAKALETQKGTYVNSVFTPFVSAESKAGELVGKLNLDNLPAEYKQRLKDLGIDEKENPADEVKDALAQILRTDPALEIREQIRQLNEQQIKPTQKELGFGYIQRESDEDIKEQAGGSALFNVFKKAGYSGTESEFYTDFFPDATPADKELNYSSKQLKTKGGAAELLGFSMPDFSDPFAAIGSLDKMFADDSTKTKQTYVPTRSTYFKYFEDEKDEGAPSYFNMGSGGGFGNLFG